MKGKWGQQDYGMRIYDPRVGRFLSVDPLTKSFPWNSPYSFSEGDPINYVDIDGAEKGGMPAQAIRVQPRAKIDPGIIKPGWDDPGGTVPRGINIPVEPVGYSIPSWLNNIDYSEYVPRGAQTATVAQNAHGVYVVGQNVNGNNYSVPIYEFRKRGEITWVDRLVAGIKMQSLNQANTFSQWNVSIQAYEVITNDPSSLSDDYLSQVQKRLTNGNATAQDKLYEGELRRRKQLYEINDKHNPAKPLGGANASVLPDNHAQLWQNRSHYDKETDTWWSVEGAGKKAVYH